MSRCVILGDGRAVTLGSYVATVRAAKAKPDATFPRSLCDWWPDVGAVIVKQFREGMHDRINQAIPYSTRGVM